MSSRIAVVMAAGKGTRMFSDLPKVLIQIHGRPMIHYVLDALRDGGIDRIVAVIGHQAEVVRASLEAFPGIAFAQQAEQLGTGHAVMACRHLLTDHASPVLVVAGDQPLMESASIAALMAEYDRRPAACILGTAHKENPKGLGRIVRDENGDFVKIVEEKDATDAERRITEVNMSYYVFHCGDLLEALGHLRTNNKQREYYITDCPGVFRAHRKEVRALSVLKPHEALGINTPEELAAVEHTMEQIAYQKKTARKEDGASVSAERNPLA